MCTHTQGTRTTSLCRPEQKRSMGIGAEFITYRTDSIVKPEPMSIATLSQLGLVAGSMQLMSSRKSVLESQLTIFADENRLTSEIESRIKSCEGCANETLDLITRKAV